MKCQTVHPYRLTVTQELHLYDREASLRVAKLPLLKIQSLVVANQTLQIEINLHLLYCNSPLPDIVPQ